MHRLSVHVMGNGERVPILHDSSGLPLFYPTLFATAKLRNAGAAVNTIRNKLADVLVLLRWEQESKRDLIAEFAAGKFLTVADVVSLRDFAKRDMRGWKVVAGSSAGSTETAVVDFLEARVGSSQAQSAIGGQQHYNRLSTFADYLEFLANTVTQHRNSNECVKQIEHMAKTIRKHRPRGLVARYVDRIEDRSPPTEIVDRFIEIGAEDHSQNPFVSPDVRLRNSIIFGLVRHTGMRRGELLSLKLEQLDFGNEPRIRIRRNQDDVHDSRSNQPVSKTKERILPIPMELAEQIEKYIYQVRANIPPARKHPYLLVVHKKGKTWGQPISVSTLSCLIFPKMQAVTPELEMMHPHAFRHYFNYRLSVSIDSHNARVLSGKQGAGLISEAREQDVRAFLNGHRDKNSSAVYNERHVREVSGEVVRKVQAVLKRPRKTSGEADGRS